MKWKAPFPGVVAVLCVFAMVHLTSANPWRTNPAFPRKLREGHSPHGEKLSSSQDSNTFPHLAHSDEDLGIVNVAMPPFSADPSGQKDATQALQSAIEYGRAHRLTIYVPLGKYKVSDTINCTEHAHGRFQPIVIVGQKARTFRYGQIQAPNRPEFFLPENTPGFMDATKPKYIVHFWEDNSLPAKGKQGLKKSNDTGSEEYNLDSEIRTSVNFNQVIQGINVVVGDGNHGAIGIRFRGAQGSAVEDCLVDLGKDGLIGVVGACGSGGSHAGVTVLGGKYGLDFRMAQPAPTITGATLINQSCSSLLYAGLQTLTAVGIKISASQSVEETLGIIASVPPEVEGEPSPWMPAEGSECFLPELPPDVQPAQPSLSGQDQPHRCRSQFRHCMPVLCGDHCTARFVLEKRLHQGLPLLTAIAHWQRRRQQSVQQKSGTGVGSHRWGCLHCPTSGHDQEEGKRRLSCAWLRLHHLGRRQARGHKRNTHHLLCAKPRGRLGLQALVGWSIFSKFSIGRRCQCNHATLQRQGRWKARWHCSNPASNRWPRHSRCAKRILRRKQNNPVSPKHQGRRSWEDELCVHSADRWIRIRDWPVGFTWTNTCNI